jgi:hypothetical protein
MAKQKHIPVAAIKIPLPDIEQPDEFSCGAASLMSICSYYDVGSNYMEAFKQALEADPEDGIYYRNIARYAEKLGLKAEICRGMSVAALKKHIDAGRPVVCSIQAYSREKRPDYDQDGHGHYVVAIGYDDVNFYFMDPSASAEGGRTNPCYGFLSAKELKLRWHDDEGINGKREPIRHLGIVIYPESSPLLRAREIT